MRYAEIRKLDVSNGVGVGISLFVQGCHFHCKNCFNQITWSFDGGKEWTQEVENRFVKMANREHFIRVSILGGEPLAPENRKAVTKLCKHIKQIGKTIWVYTGYTMEDLQNDEILDYIDVLVDGRYIDELRDMSLKFRGSANQRIWLKTKEGWRIVDYRNNGDAFYIEDSRKG